MRARRASLRFVSLHSLSAAERAQARRSARPAGWSRPRAKLARFITSSITTRRSARSAGWIDRLGWCPEIKSARTRACGPSASDACSSSLPHALSSRSPVHSPVAFSHGPARYPSSQTQSETPSKRTAPISFTPRWTWRAGTPRSECGAPILEPAAVGGVSTGAGRAARGRCPAGRRAERGVRDAGQSTQVRCLLLTPNGPDDDV